MEEQSFFGSKPSSLVSFTDTATIITSDKRDASEDRRSHKREHDRKTQQNKCHQQKEYIRSLQEQRDSLLEDRITMMKLSKRNEQLEDEKAQLEGKLSTLQREEMVAPESYYFAIMALASSGSIETKMKSSLAFVQHASIFELHIAKRLIN
ncbi:hypothetical protein V490_04753 [Pseudogymnoascus sp. VKM F-3557]|nr:hypothetical protein V490_04753 [Pseudogymnoascus sp. VKM F-3557]